MIYEDSGRTINEENTSNDGADVIVCVENIKPYISSAYIEISSASYELKDDIIIKLAV